MLEPARVDGDHSRLLQLLTVRETQVLEFASLGLTNEQVAHQLDVTVHAVKFHLASVYRKLGVTNRTDAAVAYLRSNAGPASATEGSE
jgi:DNA-binding NarL/FixJ family response regulator